MPSFTSAGVEIAYDDLQPQGQRIALLIHGFASNRFEAWRRTGWYAAFERRGARVIALDLRGHGESGKPHDPAAYADGRLAADAIALMDHLGIGQADVVGYSMGARTALALACAAPGRVANLVLGGIGGRTLDASDPGGRQAMIQAMLADDPDTIEAPLPRGFRQFADAQGEDRRALAAVLEASGPPLDLVALGALTMPVLVTAGSRDPLAGDPADLARRFAQGRAVSLPGLDHFSAIPHAATKSAVFDFLDGFDEDDFPPFE